MSVKRSLYFGGQCDAGHEINSEADLTASGRCRHCKRISDRNLKKAKSHQQIRARASHAPTEDKHMQETSAQRKIRVAEARVENTEISEQFGFDVTSVLTRPLAREPWRKFRDALKYSTERPNCEGREAEFADYLWEDRPTPEEAKAMCAGCPMFKLCEDYAAAQQVTWTVMAGKVHGEKETE